MFKFMYVNLSVNLTSIYNTIFIQVVTENGLSFKRMRHAKHPHAVPQTISLLIVE